MAFIRFKLKGPPPPVIDAWSLARDAAVLLVCMTLVPVLRYMLHTLVYEPAARAILRVPPPPQPSKRRRSSSTSSPSGASPLSSSPSLAQKARAAAELARAADPRQKLVARFCESAWKLTVYVFLLCLGCWAIGGEPWSGALLPPPSLFAGAKTPPASSSSSLSSPSTFGEQLWRGWPLHSPPSRRLSLYYLAEGSFYGASLFMLLHWEVKRADFAAMLTHHVATAVLVSASRALRYERVGSLVMALHDPSDVLLEAAKLASYAGFETAASVLFALLAASWAWLRLWVLPSRVMRSVALDAPRVLGGFPMGSRPLNAALLVLWCLHVYWFALIVKVAWGQLTGGRLRDARESDDGIASGEGAAVAAGGGGGDADGNGGGNGAGKRKTSSSSSSSSSSKKSSSGGGSGASASRRPSTRRR